MNAPPFQYDPRQSPAAPNARPGVTAWIWVIVKNLLGWALIVAAWPVGILLPGPGGIPLFLIGFALVTFPGKRKLTARILRGKRLRLDRMLYTAAAAVVAVLIPPLLLWFVLSRYLPPHEIRKWEYAEWGAALVAAMAIIWLSARLSLRILSWLIVGVPRVRRRVRPWLRHHGIRLLPPRWRRHHPSTGPRHRPHTEDILMFHGRRFQRLRRIWNKLVLRRKAGGRRHRP